MRGRDYAQIIVVAVGIAQIQSQQNTTALELRKAMRNLWQIAGHNNDNKEDNDICNDSVGLETSLGTVKDKQSLVGKQKCFDCGKKGHMSAKCPRKKNKGPKINDDWKREICPKTIILLLCKLMDTHQTCSPPITSPNLKK
jgi:hypothetical protein